MTAAAFAQRPADQRIIRYPRKSVASLIRQMERAHTYDEICLSLWEDSYFSLMPGEIREAFDSRVSARRTDVRNKGLEGSSVGEPSTLSTA